MDVRPWAMHGSRRSDANVNDNQPTATNFGNQRWAMESAVVVSEVAAGCSFNGLLVNRNRGGVPVAMRNDIARNKNAFPHTWEKATEFNCKSKLHASWESKAFKRLL